MTEKLSRSAVLTIVTMMAGTFLIILNQTLLSPVLPVLMEDFSIEATVVQWLTSGYSLVMAVVIPLSPYLLGHRYELGDLLKPLQDASLSVSRSCR